MPRLPSVDQIQRETPQPARGIASFDGSAVPRAVAQLGQVAGDVLEKQSRETDTQAVFAARRKLDDFERMKIYDPQNGAINKLGKDAFGLGAVVRQDFDDFSGKVGAELTTPRQKQAYQEVVTSRRDQLLDWSSRHEQQQREAYDRGQFEADIKNSEDRAAQLAGDPARVSAEVAVMRDRTIGYYRNKGLSEEQTQQALRTNTEKLHVSVLNTLLAGDDWRGAKSYLNANASQMDPATSVRLNTVLRKQEDTVEGAKAAQLAVQQIQPAMQPTDFGRVLNITMQSESGGRRYAPDGKTLLTSPAGAKGEMQVMDGTNRDPGFGVIPAKDDSPDERARVGRDYMGAMVKEFGGDVSKAWAAYNGGPAAVKDAQRKADEARLRAPNATSSSDDYWLTFMPQETQSYVAKNMRALGNGGGTPSRPTLQDVHSTLRASLSGASPERVKVALDESTRLYKETTDSIKQREDDAVAEAQRALVQNGGSWAALPPAVRNSVPPAKVDDLLNFGQRLTKGEDNTDPVVFQKMATDDGWLKGLSDAEFYFQSRKLSQSDAQQMATRRGGLINKQTPQGQKPTDLDFGAIKTILDQRLTQMGIDPTPSDKDKDAQQRVGAIRTALQGSILDGQVASGKKFDDAELTKRIDKAITQQVQFQQKGFFGGVTQSSERLLTMQTSDIPPAVREKLTADFARAGVAKPSDGDILGAYLHIKLSQGK